MKVLYVTLCLAIATAVADDVMVTTDVGSFVGFSDEIDVDGTPFRLSKFLGIPYAEAPVGNLRFRKPVPKSALSEPLEVKQYGSVCMHAVYIPGAPTAASEDCLFLNVYTPGQLSDSKDKYPVMLWIHGGGFVIGSSNAAPDGLVAKGRVVVVTINYRLSVWGFLSTQDSNSLGNYGLWDQHLAIRWVHDNIAAFGGDPTRVTIFGASAGSASVIYQGWYPGNVGLFQRIIGQSGSPLAAWASALTPLSDAKTLAELTDCENEDNGKMVECLRGLDNDILNATLNDLSNGLITKPLTFVPHPDGEFVSECNDAKPYSACRSVFSNFDLMTGLTSGEGYLLIPPAPWEFEAQNKFLPNRTHFKDTIIPQFVQSFNGEISNVLVESIVSEYTDWSDPESPEVLREVYCDIMRDFFFLLPAKRTVELHAELTSRQSTYLYYFTQTPSAHVFPTPSWATRPNHGDDLVYMLGEEGDFSEFGMAEIPQLEPWEKVFADDIMTLFTNFAKTGNPNKPRDISVDWLPYTNKHGHYLDMAMKMRVRAGLERRHVNFWNSIVPAIRKECMSKATTETNTCTKDGNCDP